MSLRKGKKEYETIQDIISYTETALKDSELERSDLLKHFETCPFCSVEIVQCSSCGKPTPFNYKCVNCKKVLPLETLIRQLAKKTVEK
jgi:predicted RNA-binding Zn-ribbon protein involved in translation (DUF1610 family)